MRIVILEKSFFLKNALYFRMDGLEQLFDWDEVLESNHCGQKFLDTGNVMNMRENRDKLIETLNCMSSCLRRINRMEGLGENLHSSQAFLIKKIGLCDNLLHQTYWCCKIFTPQSCGQCKEKIQQKLNIDRRFFRERVRKIEYSLSVIQGDTYDKLLTNVNDIIENRPVTHKTPVKIEPRDK